MANKGSIITYQYPILGGAIGCSYTAGSSSSYTWDIAKSTFNWSIASQDVVNNRTTFNWSLAVQFYNNTGTASIDTLSVDELYIYDSTKKYEKVTLHFDGTAKTVARGKTVTVYSGSFVFDHEDDGTFTFPLEIRMAMSAGTYDSNDAIETTTNITLDTISRHALIYSAHDFTDEETVAIEYAVPSGITGYIYLSLDGAAGTETTALKAVTGAGTYIYSFSANDQRQLWSILDQGLDNKQVRFFIKSTSNIDGIEYREPSNWVNLRIVNYMPTLDPRVVDSNPATVLLTGDNEKLIRYASTASFTTGAEAKKHYYIATESCSNGGNPIYGATGEFPNVTSNYFTFTATDNAGRRVQTGLEVPPDYGYWIEYVKLTCNATTTEMTADGDVKITVTGKYFDGSFGEQSNALKITCVYTENNGEPQTRTFTDVDPIMNENDYTYQFTLDGLNYLSVYEVQVIAEDKVMPQPAVANLVVASTPIFDWGRQDFNFNVPVTIQGGLVPGIVEQGTHWSGWNYRKWSDGLYECWQRKVIPTMLGNASSASGWYSSGAISETNISYPITFVEPPTVNVSLTPTTNTWALVVPGSTPGTTEETGVFQLLATYSHEFANRDYIFNYQVKGKWK